MTVRLDPSVDLDEQAQALSSALATVKTDGYDVSVAQTAGFTSNGLSIVVSGADPDRVHDATDTVMQAISGRTDLVNLTSDLVQATPEIEVRVDPNKAVGIGSTAAQIAGEVRALLTPTSVTTVNLSDSGVAQLIVRADPAIIGSVDELRAVLVGTVRRVPLGTVAEVEQVDVQGSITRIDGAPAAQITAEITSADTGHGVARDRRQGRRAQGERIAAGRRRRPPGRCDRADERGLRRPVHLDGGGHPARLRDDGARLQLAA